MSNFNGREAGSHCWFWPDAPYVGYGPIGHADGSMPWQRKWSRRHDDPSPLGAWLRSLDAPPRIDWSHLPSVALTRATACQLAAIRRRQLRGVKLLADRCYSGSGPWCRVVVDGVEYRSLREAARATGFGRYQLWQLYHLGRLFGPSEAS